MIYLDTESVGLYGPTVLIQWGRKDKSVNLHGIFNKPAGETCNLIELLMEETICGFNLSHDSYHINKTYNTLKQLPAMATPDILTYRDAELSWVKDGKEGLFTYCCKPKHALDLLIVGKKGTFQPMMGQKDIVLKKVPRAIAKQVLAVLYKKVKIPSIYFGRSAKGYEWKISQLHANGKEITPEELAKFKSDPKAYPILLDNDFVNLKLSFSPTAALKAIVEHIKGEKVVTLDELRPLKRPAEYEYNPFYHGWMEVAREHIWAWANDIERLEYAKNDVIYLPLVEKFLRDNGSVFTTPDSDSDLAWAVGCNYWHGFNIDVGKAKHHLVKTKKSLEGADINFNAPKQVLKYLHSVCSPLECEAIPNTKVETLEGITKDPDWAEEPVTERCLNVLKWRHLDKERDLMEKLIIARRLHVVFKVIGTKSNRMSGGSESFVSSKGSINPQGIKKSPTIRGIFMLHFPGLPLSGGDFDGFEVGIAEAEYNDPELRKDLLSGKKIHALYAEAMYNIPYDEIMQYKEFGAGHPKGWYSRGKTAFFGKLYGAQNKKLGEVLWLSEEEIDAGNERFFSRYKGVREAQDRVYTDHMALRQLGDIGSPIEWVQPKYAVESFLGFKRDFSLEYSICRTLFELANDLPDDIKEAGKKIKVVRRERVQTGSGAAMSSIFAAAFNIQSQIMRSATNHKIQSPGGQLTKELQSRIWEYQPCGVKRYKVLLMNVHDEIMAMTTKKISLAVKQTVNEFIEEKKKLIPLMSMTWKTNLLDWSKK